MDYRVLSLSLCGLQYLRQVINYIITNVEAQIFLLVAGTVKKQTIFNIYYGQIADMQETKVSITGILELKKNDYMFRISIESTVL